MTPLAAQYAIKAMAKERAALANDSITLYHAGRTMQRNFREGLGDILKRLDQDDPAYEQVKAAIIATLDSVREAVKARIVELDEQVQQLKAEYATPVQS